MLWKVADGEAFFIQKVVCAYEVTNGTTVFK